MDRGVTTLLGAHVEMSTAPGVDFAPTAPTRPNVHALPLALAQLDELVTVVDQVAAAPRLLRRDRLILTHLP